MRIRNRKESRFCISLYFAVREANISPTPRHIPDISNKQTGINSIYQLGVKVAPLNRKAKKISRKRINCIPSLAIFINR